MLEPPLMVRIVQRVGKASFCSWGSWICGRGGGGGFFSILTWGLLFCFGYVIWGIGAGYIICGAGGGMLFVELARAVSDLVWRSGRTDNMLKVEFGWPGMFVEKGRGRMGSIVDGGSIVWCG
jgi:hypothetical protein